MSRLSDGVLVATIAGPIALIAAAPGHPGTGTVAVMFGETLLLANGLTQVSKTVFRRVRPFVYNDDAAIPPDRKTSRGARQSFPSGHAATAFASAVFLSTVYARLYPASPARPWIWGGSLALAGTVGYLRYHAGRHFPTDILAGAALGGVVGWIVPRMHEGDRVRVMAAPGGSGVVAGVAFRF
jgi:membrane-associated phospholipid phosphatase